MSNDQNEIFRKFREAEMKAGQNVDPESLMTNQDIHEFGIETICNYARQEGYEIVDGATDLNQHPQIVLKKNEQLYFVMVKTGPGDGMHLNYNKDLGVYDKIPFFLILTNFQYKKAFPLSS